MLMATYVLKLYLFLSQLNEIVLERCGVQFEDAYVCDVWV